MPKINRIRIVNFFYNNDNREIQDETYRLYDGENTLFNLSNGGGKSVLIQLIMQPVVPDLKIQKRSMAGYFKRNMMPAFVMIEWLLDNPSKKDYLMTGIAVAPKGGNSEESNKINYYTFMSHYDRASLFDISELPFVRRGEGKVSILPYERSREEVRKLAANNREVFYYSKDDAAAYRRQLQQFGISQDEWKNIIAKMNNDEGGIDELFERCATSNKVFDEWILKTVEKAIMAGETNDTQIQELLDGLVADTLKNDSYIQDEQVMKAYFQVHEEMEQQLNRLYQSMEAYENVKQRLASMHGSVQKKLKNDKLDLEELGVREYEQYEEQKRIDQEEASEEYYEACENLTEASERFEEKEREIGQKKAEHEDVVKNIRIQNASRKYGAVQSSKAAAAAIRMKLEQMDGDDTISGHLKDLKYTLSIRYREIGAGLADEQQQREGKKKQYQQEINLLIEESERLEAEIQAEARRLGELQEKIRQFKGYEERLFEELQIQLSRNVLGELVPTETEEQRKVLETTFAGHKERQGELAERLPVIAGELEQIQQNKLKVVGDIADTQNNIAVQQQDITEFEEKEQHCKQIAVKYEIEEELLYEKPELTRRLAEKGRLLEERKRLHSLEQNQVQEMIKGIRENRIYIPGLILKELDKYDIEYISGEAYLSNLAEEKRRQLLVKNPLIPFALIIKVQDLQKLQQVQMKQLFLRQIIPVFTFEQLTQAFTEQNQLLSIADELYLLGKYEESIFADRDKISYIEQLEAQSVTLVEMLEHLEQEIKGLHQDEKILEGFTYEKGEYQKMIKRLETLNGRLEQLGQYSCELDVQKAERGTEREDTLKKLEQQKEACRNAEHRLQLYLEFLNKDSGYMTDSGEFSKTNDRKQEKERSKQQKGGRQRELREQCGQEEAALHDLRTKAEQNKKLTDKFEDAEEAELLTGTTVFLCGQYEDLSRQLQSSVQELNDRLEEEKKRQADLKEEIEELNLEPAAYENVTYDKAAARRLAEVSRELEGQLERLQKSWTLLHSAKSKCEALAETAKKRLGTAGLEAPLDKQMIRQNYANRRKQIRFELEGLKEKRDQLRRVMNICEQVAGWIKQILPNEIIRYDSFELAADIQQQYEQLLDEYKGSDSECRKQLDVFYRQYQIARAEYYEKHQCIADILDAVKQMEIGRKEQSFEMIYFHIEEFIKKKENLRKLLDFYASQLEKISHTKKQIIDQCISYATLIYEDIRLIAKRSKIRLRSKSRAVQMLKLDIPQELDNQIYQRMEQHIENALKLMVELSHSDQDKDSRKYREKIRSFASTRELLNQLIGTNRIQVYVYKIDLNESNSGLKKWEDAIAENSGGEKFVVFFTMISVLISYTREAAGRSMGIDAMKDSKVILMDNPFARTSSEHLLKAVMDIAKTFDIQLICLSDLSQSSITNRFALIYQLAVRKKMYSEKEQLKIGGIQINKDGIAENERLEHAAVYERYIQNNLFDIGEWNLGN